jgi:hypothetical protein
MRVHSLLGAAYVFSSPVAAATPCGHLPSPTEQGPSFHECFWRAGWKKMALSSAGCTVSLLAHRLGVAWDLAWVCCDDVVVWVAAWACSGSSGLFCTSTMLASRQLHKTRGSITRHATKQRSTFQVVCKGCLIPTKLPSPGSEWAPSTGARFWPRIIVTCWLVSCGSFAGMGAEGGGRFHRKLAL